MDNEKKIRLEIAKSIFKEVLDANLHQGEKASRLLIPVTFLVAAATFLFEFFLGNNVSAVWRGIDFIPVLFLLYLIFTLAGAIVIIETIGPSFEIKGWPGENKGKEKKDKGKKKKNKGKEEDKNPESLLFFKFIIKKDVSDWMKIFLNEEAKKLNTYLETDNLHNRLIHDYVVEAYQLAKKTQGKVKKNFFSHILFYISFCSLVLMTYSGIVSYLALWNQVTQLLIGIILCGFGILIFEVIKEYSE
ncbi:MAG: hypothetical protein PVF58_04220 [Candidatus Methanofastidiosia archaeon]|jgi:hypothetical protein